MAKQISQSTFDDVVRENMTEFEMNPEEAIEDAVQQFESQGVNLSIIVKDPHLYASGDSSGPQDHPVVKSLKDLSADLNAPQEKMVEISEALKAIQIECDVDLARRCLAGSNSGYPTLLRALVAYKDNPEKLSLALTTFCSLVNGQPDLLDESGTEFLINLLRQYAANVDILQLAVKAIRLNCIKHEANRQGFIQLDLIILLTDLLKTYKSNASLIKELCACLRSLTVDDDVRVPFGKAHENAKSIATEGDGLKTILSLCEEHLNDQSVLGELFLTLSCLAVRNEFCQEVMDGGGVKLIINAFQSAIAHKVVVRQALTVLKVLAGNDEVKTEVSKLGGIELVILAMNTHQNVAPVAEAALRVLTAITLRNVENCKKVVECQGHHYIVQAMKLHPGDVGVQKQACMALRNLVSRTKELSEAILALGTEILLNAAMNQHKGAADEAKAALRDLGCKVELKELWKGEKGTLQ